jgi:hypothetical protein
MQDLKDAIFNINTYILEQNTQTQKQLEKKLKVINDLKLITKVVLLIIDRQNKLLERFKKIKEMRKSLIN